VGFLGAKTELRDDALDVDRHEREAVLLQRRRGTRQGLARRR
jgi:hypothetical protein